LSAVDDASVQGAVLKHDTGATRSDLIMTLTSITLSLIPGSLVLEADRENSILYLHVLNTPDLDAVEKAREQVLLIERRIVRALGSHADLERLNA
jgi:multicomponent Na+:H+ antiporter subunit E